MSHSLVINFSIDQAEFNILIHRVRNFGEDIDRFLRTNGWGSIDMGEVDSATTQLIIRAIKRSKLRRVSVWVEEEMGRQYLLGNVEVR